MDRVFPKYPTTWLGMGWDGCWLFTRVGRTTGSVVVVVLVVLDIPTISGNPGHLFGQSNCASLPVAGGRVPTTKS